MSKKSVYFAAEQDISRLGDTLIGKVESWNATMKTNGLSYKIKQCWAMYHGVHLTNFSNSHQVTFSGEQGEIANLVVNHVRNIAQHMKTMTLATRPSLEARAANTDPKSLVQATLATGLLDYYMRERRLERYIADAVESAIVLGSGFVKVEWDASAGKVIEEDEEGNKIYEGDLKFSNISPFNVIFDINREDQDHDWMITVAYKNKFDLMAKHPSFADEIDGLATKDKYDTVLINKQLSTDDIPIFTFYHRPTEALPGGREVVFLASDIVLSDQELPYSKIPIYRIAPNEVMGTPFGYSAIFDLMPLQEAINTVYTSIFSNQVAFGTQNIFVETGANLQTSQLSGGLNIIEGLKKPEPLNLLATSAESFEFVKMMEHLMETISGINSVARGNPEAHITSGNAMALVQSMAIQFINGLQQQYVQLLEDVGSAVIDTLKLYASEPRVASIIGKNNKAYLKQFKAEDIMDVNRVVVEVGNPLAKTTAGRIQMAEQLMQMKADEFTIDQYIQVINTGKLEVMTDKNTRKMNQIELENERLMQGRQTKVLILDDHVTHIQEHSTLLDDPDVRDNDALSQVILDHIQQHMDLGRSADPILQQALKHQVIAPPPVPPMDPNMQSGISPTDVPGASDMMNPANGNPPPQNVPNPAKVDPSLTLTPELQQMMVGNLKGQ